MVTETMIEKVQRIIKDSKYIRNICTSAHIHHGKCISGDSRIFLANGFIATAKDIFENILKNGNSIAETEAFIIYTPKNKVKIISLNSNTKNFEKKEIQHAWRLKGGKTITISLENGLIMTTTPEHKYFIYNKDFQKVEARNLKIGDQISCISNAINLLSNYEILTNGGLLQKQNFIKKQLEFIEISKIEENYNEVVYDFTIPDNHNFIAEGMVISNTAFTDNLLAASGKMAAKCAGDLEQGMATWQHSDEQERLMTVDAANVSMVHDFEGKEFLINLIDTPGHIDFSGNVTRAMRAIDGTIVLVCAVEGIMPQTETVLRQALKERVKPVLFINKVDRLIKEVKLTPEKMQERFMNIYKEFNQLIEKIAEPEYGEKWKVDIINGSVAFGSARENWALSVPFMKKKGVNFKDIITLYEMEEEKKKEWCWQNAPLFEVILDMVVKHLPDPTVAQRYRIPKIWKGELDSELGKALLNCDPNGKPAFVITRVMIDPRYGKEMSAGRLFSGKLEEGMEVYLNLAKKKQRIQQVLIYNGIKPEQIHSITAGNVLAITGVSGEAGETVTLEPETIFEELKHIFEPVITKSIEATKTADLPKLIEILRKVGKEDPSIKIEINEETGENLISGMGELHLEIIENRIVTEKGLHVKTSPPIVTYRETVTKKSPEIEGKSPNKHNKFYITVEPLSEEVYQAIRVGDLPQGRLRKKDEESIVPKLVQLGWETKEAKKIRAIINGCIFTDSTRGIVQISEVIELVLDGFEQVMKGGPLARENCIKMLVKLTDCKLHEDSIHRGPAQVYPAVREAIREAMNSANASIFEPLQILQIDVPEEFMGNITKLVSSIRGQLLDMNREGSLMVIKVKIPVAEMFGLSSELRSASEGRGNFFIIDQTFEKVPTDLQAKVIQQIRQRKGLSENA
ncbi:elongation factor EF-2 [Candidatus Woesearchaeota archaeon]|nr:elongation factor EF-2 [Candidatus Woesearchaeota archaeon]